VSERISTLDVRKRLGEILDRVALRNDRFVIERKGKALAAIVPVATLEKLEQLAREHVLEILDRQRGGGLTDDEAEALAVEVTHQVRRRR